MVCSKKGLTLIEIVIAALILSLGMAASLRLFYTLDEILVTSSYFYTATNLARDVLEFGEGAQFTGWFKMWYKYPPGKKDYGHGVNKTEGYGLKEWEHFAAQNPDPFDFLGDIEKKRLVPTEFPHSVEIYYEARQDTNFYNAFREDVNISWEVRENEVENLELSVIPIVTNNQLNLEIQDFWWE
jgi:prepilin-type N-terminal cleavage/methylation domain-containing protein